MVDNLPLEGDIHQREGNPVQEDSHQGQGDTLQEAGNLDQEGGNQLWGDILHLEEEDNHPKKRTTHNVMSTQQHPKVPPPLIGFAFFSSC